MADVQLRHPETLEVRTVSEAAVPFHANQGFVVLDAAGRVKAKQPTTTGKEI